MLETDFYHATRFILSWAVGRREATFPQKVMIASVQEESGVARPSFTKLLVISGIASSVLYAAMTIFIPLAWTEYSSVSQTVSELSAIGSPTRSIWFPLGVVYAITFGVFGIGVVRASGNNSALRVAGGLVILYASLSIYWPPMHLRGEERSLTDMLHIVWTIVTVVLMIAIMGFAAAALKHAFLYYTILSVVLLVSFGLLTSAEAPNIVLNLPTPRIGIWERLNIGLFMIWVIVFASALLKRENRKMDDHIRFME